MEVVTNAKDVTNLTLTLSYANNQSKTLTKKTAIACWAVCPDAIAVF